MTLDEYQGHLRLAYWLAEVAAAIPVPDLIERIDRAEAVGPFLDPTLYRATAGKMAEDREVLEALLPAHRRGVAIRAATGR